MEIDLKKKVWLEDDCKPEQLANITQSEEEQLRILKQNLEMANAKVREQQLKLMEINDCSDIVNRAESCLDNVLLFVVMSGIFGGFLVLLAFLICLFGLL